MATQWTIVDLGAGDEEIEAARSLLAPDELRRAARFLREVDRRHFVAARAALRRTLAKALGGDARDVAFRYGRHGKPSLAGTDGTIRFNLSHAGGRALIAWTRGIEIGVDIENVRAVRYGGKIARRYFSDDEQRAFAGLADERWNEAFFRCWTRKEAFIKAVGDGLSYPLRTFTVPMEPTVAAGDIRVDGAGASSTAWKLDTVDAGSGFVAAIVTEGANRPASS